MTTTEQSKIVLTGDRPTGPLHLGHYVGSLANRLALQDNYKQYIMIADVQALTDNYEHPEKVRHNVVEVALDYLAIGIDPAKSTIFIQSEIPQIAELTIFFMNLVTVSRLKRNPTIKTEIHQRKFGENIPTGFLTYPISQAADITIVKANVVPVGEDQLPIIEQTNEIVRSFNRIYQTTLFPQAEPLLSKIPRLPGTDGKHKMSKSAGNAIFLSDSTDVLVKKVRSMYTDPLHVRIEDPGHVENNPVFAYLDAFDLDKAEVERLKAHYQQGGLGDMTLKKRLIEVLEAFLTPIRQKRTELAKNPDQVMNVLKNGTEMTKVVTQKTMQEVRQVMHLDYF